MDHFHDVCVVLGADAWNRYQNDALHESKPLTRNKLYVACSRARGNLYFVSEKLLNPFKQSLS